MPKILTQAQIDQLHGQGFVSPIQAAAAAARRAHIPAELA
jgi:hypothetical protein